MPQLFERTPDTIATSIGGSTIYGAEGIATHFITELSCFLQEQVSAGRTVVAAVGGGDIARSYRDALIALGITGTPPLDRLGIKVTQVNAEFLFIAFNGLDMNVQLRRPGDHMRRGVIYLMSGTVYGQTTDKIAVEAALEADVNVVFNISTSPLHPVIDGHIDYANVIEDMTWDEFLQMAPKDHAPGMHFPFDPNAAQLARDNGITVVLLGTDLDNARQCLDGENFVGTIIHP